MTVKPGEPVEVAAVIMDMGDDPLAPSEFATEIVEHMEKFEDLEGDGPAMQEKLNAAIQQELDRALKDGIFDEKAVSMQMMIRDPNDGSGTLIVNAKIEHDPENGFKIEANPCWSHINDAEFSEQGREALGEFATSVVEGFDEYYSPAENNEFMQENANNYTYAISTSFTPGAPGS